MKNKKYYKKPIKTIKSYSSYDIKIISKKDNLIEGVDISLNDFIEYSLNNNSRKILYIGRINNNIAKNINTLLADNDRYNGKYNLFDYNITIVSDDIRHILNRHSKEHNQISVTINKLSKYAEVISNPDYIGISNIQKRDNLCLIFFKKINGYSVAIETVSKKKKMSLKTFYILKTNSKEFYNFLDNNNLIRIKNKA